MAYKNVLQFCERECERVQKYRGLLSLKLLLFNCLLVGIGGGHREGESVRWRRGRNCVFFGKLTVEIMKLDRVFLYHPFVITLYGNVVNIFLMEHFNMFCL